MLSRILFCAISISSAFGQDRPAAEWALRSGGRVQIAGQAVYIDQLAALPPGDFRLSGVDLIGTIIPPPELGNLSGLSELRELLLPGPIFNPGAGSNLDANAELKALAPLAKLEKLHFSLHFLTNINVQDKGLAHLKGLTALRELRLAQTRVKGASLAPFVNLEKLDLNYSSFDDESMKHLAGLTKLKSLSLRDTLITDAGMTHLAGLVNLESLDLYGARITGTGLAHLKKLARLRSLNLLGASLTDDSMEILAGMRELEELNLYRSQITNAGLAKLAPLQRLAVLDLRYTRVTRSGVDEFRRGHPDAEIEFQDASPRGGNRALRTAKPAAATEAAVANWIRLIGGKIERADRGSIELVDLSRTAVSDAQLSHLKPLANLKKLILDATEVGDLAGDALAALGSLEEVSLANTLVSDKLMLPLGKLTKLRRVVASNTLVTGSQMAALCAAPLVSLDVSATPFHDGGAKQLQNCQGLKDLRAPYSSLTNEGAAALGALTALERLDLTATDIGDAGLQHLASLRNLRELMISYAPFTDKGVAHLAPLQNLQRLEMARTRVTDAAVADLQKLGKLRVLNLDYTGITGKSLAGLASLPALEVLRLDTATVGDDDVEALAAFKNLKELNLYHTLLTDKGYERLKQALPAAKIVYDRESALPNRRRS